MSLDLCGTGSASVMFRFDVDSLRLQLAGRQRASCGIDGTVVERATCLRYSYTGRASATFRSSVLCAVASMERFSKERLAHDTFTLADSAEPVSRLCFVYFRKYSCLELPPLIK